MNLFSIIRCIIEEFFQHTLNSNNAPFEFNVCCTYMYVIMYVMIVSMI